MNFMSNCGFCKEFKRVKAEITLNVLNKNGDMTNNDEFEICEDCLNKIKAMAGVV